MDFSAKDIWLLVLGAILGYLPILIPQLKKIRLQNTIKQRKKLLQSARVYDWLMKYHKSKGNTKDLYEYEYKGELFKLPFLVKPEWLYFSKEDMSNDSVLQFNGIGGPFPVDTKLIERKKRFSQKIFNDPTLYIEALTVLDNRLAINVKQCGYFEMISAISRLEEESIRGISRNNVLHLTIRDKYLGSANIAAKQHDLPFSVGCVVLLALKTENGYEVLIQRRSGATATYGGYKSVIPSYGLSPKPVSNNFQSLAFYNFIKEFAEELYDFEELIQQMASKRGDDLWFLNVNEISEVVQSFKDGGSEFIFTGFGIDLLNGTNTLSYLALINDITLVKKIKNRIIGNWETEATDSERAIEFIHFKDEKLTQAINEKQYHFGSAFCVFRGIEYIDHFSTETISNP